MDLNVLDVYCTWNICDHDWPNRESVWEQLAYQENLVGVKKANKGPFLQEVLQTMSKNGHKIVLLWANGFTYII